LDGFDDSSFATNNYLIEKSVTVVSHTTW